MKILLLCLALFVSPIACGAGQTPGTIATDVIDCIKAEGSAVTKNIDLFSAALEIADIIVSFRGDWKTGVEGLVTRFGEPVVACAIKAIETEKLAGEGSSAGAALTVQKQTAAEIINHYGWKFSQ